MHALGCPPLDHLDRMTDSAGLIQHAVYTIPRRSSGYTTDDNARALRLCARLCAGHADERMVERVACYLSFLEHAQRPTGGFHNFMSYQRDWLDTNGCCDSQGQAVLALAEVCATNLPQGFRDLAKELINNSASMLREITGLRAHAYVIQAWAVMRRASIPDIGELESIALNAVDCLVDAWNASRQTGWEWFEPQMTYANAVLPHAMFDAAEAKDDEELLFIAETSFRFLDEATTSGDVFWPIGNHGWYAQNQEKSLYDQQPVEASTMAAAALAAFQLRNHQDDEVAFQKAHGWFHGTTASIARWLTPKPEDATTDSNPRASIETTERNPRSPTCGRKCWRSSDTVTKTIRIRRLLASGRYSNFTKNERPLTTIS